MWRLPLCRAWVGRPRLGTAALLLSAALALVSVTLILDMAPLVCEPAQGPRADLRLLVVADEGATAGLVLNVLDARHKAADPVRQLVIAT